MLLLRQLSTTTMCTQKPNDVNYEEPKYLHTTMILADTIGKLFNEAYSVHKSGNERTTEMRGETCSQEVDLKSNEAYGVRGEVQESYLKDEEANREGALYDAIETN